MTTVVWPHRANPLLGMTDTPPASSRTARAARPAAGGRTVRVVMAGGGTGGHLYPGLAVADALRALAAAGGPDGDGLNVELLWAATPRPVDQRLLSKFGDRYIRQPVQPLVKAVGKLWGFWRGWRESCRYWTAYFSEHDVHCVVALGGYAAGPASYVAAKRGIPVVLLNPDALPGLANRFLLKRADVVVTQWPLAAAYQGAIKGKAKALGCPIRPELVERSRVDGAARLGVDPAVNTLVVTGASLGAKTINDAVLAMLADAGARTPFDAAATGKAAWQIIHLAGVDQAAAVREAYARYPGLRVKVIDYCDDMASLWAVADLAIARAGASTCAELTACGVPSVLLPYPFHKDMHQRANAVELVKAGAAVIVDDAKDAGRNAAAIKSMLDSLLYDDDRRTLMAEAAQVAGKPQAAAAIAGEILAAVASSSR
jgi:UDP-N-acetylglucosamine--N-acetylmuramyl-(pentapeptide) pyrophosphoryl-undecaprenol N-acetylglucosamine transferase